MKIRILLLVLAALALILPVAMMVAPQPYDHRYDALAAGESIRFEARLDKSIEGTVHPLEVYHAVQQAIVRRSRGGGLAMPDVDLPYASGSPPKLVLSVREERGPSLPPGRRRFVLDASLSVPNPRTGKYEEFYRRGTEAEVNGKNDPMTMTARRHEVTMPTSMGDQELLGALDEALPQALDEFSGQLGAARAARGYTGRTASRLGDALHRMARSLGLERSP